MKIRALLILLLFFTCINSASAQKKNGKVTIELEKGGVEKGKIKDGRREGVWKSYNSKGQQIQEENFLNGKRSGPFWREVDSLTITGNYLAGSRNGTFITTINGRVVSDINYRMDTLHGKYYTSTDDKTVRGTYDHGRKTGLRVVDSLDYLDNHIKDSTYFVNGLRDGSSVFYVEGKLISQTQWMQGKRNGAYREYDPTTGKLIVLGSFTEDKRDGIWRKYQDGKLVSVEDYENGIHVANTITYGRDTTVVTQIESYYPNGERRVLINNDEDGRLMRRWYFSEQGNSDSAISYYPNGRLRDSHHTSYTNNDGMTQFYLYTSYHANGKLESKGYKHRMNRTGTWLMYDSLGKLQTSISYLENLPFGWFKAYHPNGKMKLQAYCYESITDTILVYDKNGTRIPQSKPEYSKTINEIQNQYPQVVFRDPNQFPADHKRKGVVSLGDPIKGEGKWSDEPAMYPGGNDSLNAFIKRTIRFPEPERRLSKEGEVYIKFLVEKDGTLSDIQIIQVVPNAPGFTKETMRLMRVMPKWTPAKTKGKIVRVYYTLPVKFYLE